jgi:hypothetical protein
MEEYVDILLNMKTRDKIRKLVKSRGIRGTARDLDFDPGGLYRMINGDLRMSTAERILDVLGYELQIVKKGSKQSKRKEVK